MFAAPENFPSPVMLTIEATDDGMLMTMLKPSRVRPFVSAVSVDVNVDEGMFGFCGSWIFIPAVGFGLLGRATKIACAVVTLAPYVSIGVIVVLCDVNLDGGMVIDARHGVDPSVQLVVNVGYSIILTDTTPPLLFVSPLGPTKHARTS
eukprot:12621_6